jgi:hypothetical protein
MVSDKNLNARKPNATGWIVGIVGGHGGDVYWVAHTSKKPETGDTIPGNLTGAYCFTEFELVPPPPKTLYDFLNEDV